MMSLVAICVMAQGERKFSPQQFEAELEAFVTKEAKMTQQEAAAYFPLLREMHQKQRKLYSAIRKGKNAPANEQAYAEAISQGDAIGIEVKTIEQQYHQQMLKSVPASKVYAAIKAEERFHRRMMKGWQQHAKKPKGRDR